MTPGRDPTELRGLGSPCVSRIRVYPLKGAAGFDLGEAWLGPLGVPGDRRWMLTRPGGMFLSQRTHPRLALVRVVEGGRGGRDGSGSNGDPGWFKVTAPAMEPTVLEPVDSGERVPVQVHGDRFEAVRVGDAAARWFSSFLGEPCDLVFFPEGFERPVDPEWAPRHHVGFADGYPLLLASSPSLRDVEARTGVSLAMTRFRPNLVVESAEPWEEDCWRRLRLGEAEVELVKPCARCSVVTVDPATASRGREPLRSMGRFRALAGKVYFGQNGIVARSGSVRVGDSVHISERDDARPDLAP